jgi:universal stress protein A
MFTILFPTDFSQPAAHALEYAIALAQKVGGKLLLLHAVPVPLQDPNTFFKASEVYSKDEAKAKLDALHGQIAARVPCESILKVGHSVTEGPGLDETVGNRLGNHRERRGRAVPPIRWWAALRRSSSKSHRGPCW